MKATHTRSRLPRKVTAKNELATRLEQLPPMRVASVRAISETPERDAWERLQAWAAPRGLLADLRHHPVFGFDNPPPAPGHKEYGYEFWIRVDPDTPRDPAVELKDFEGGMFLVTTCRLVGDPAGDVGEVWKKLWRSVQKGPYRWRPNHELEKPHDPLAPETETCLDLYLPVRPTFGYGRSHGTRPVKRTARRR